MKSSLFGIAPLALFLVSACNVAKNPNTAIDALVKDFGYIGFQNPVSSASTGTMIGGRPSAVSYIASANDCFSPESVQRYEDFSEYSRKYSYTFQGSLGFLASANPIISAGLGLNQNVYVNIELSGLTTEYMSSIDVTDWYLNGMSETCKQYLDDVGFIIQALKVDQFKLSFFNKKGVSINLNADNISQYLGFNIGTQWEIQDETTVVISTPKYIGYQLGSLRLESEGRTLWRAMSQKKDKYIFESIAVFDDLAQSEQAAPLVGNKEMIDNNAIYMK